MRETMFSEFELFKKLTKKVVALYEQGISQSDIDESTELTEKSAQLTEKSAQLTEKSAQLTEVKSMFEFIGDQEALYAGNKSLIVNSVDMILKDNFNAVKHLLADDNIIFSQQNQSLFYVLLGRNEQALEVFNNLIADNESRPAARKLLLNYVTLAENTHPDQRQSLFKLFGEAMVETGKYSANQKITTQEILKRKKRPSVSKTAKSDEKTAREGACVIWSIFNAGMVDIKQGAVKRDFFSIKSSQEKAIKGFEKATTLRQRYANLLRHKVAKSGIESSVIIHPEDLLKRVVSKQFPNFDNMFRDGGIIDLAACPETTRQFNRFLKLKISTMDSSDASCQPLVNLQNDILDKIKILRNDEIYLKLDEGRRHGLRLEVKVDDMVVQELFNCSQGFVPYSTTNELIIDERSPLLLEVVEKVNTLRTLWEDLSKIISDAAPNIDKIETAATETEKNVKNALENTLKSYIFSRSLEDSITCGINDWFSDDVHKEYKIKLKELLQQRTETGELKTSDIIETFMIHGGMEGFNVICGIFNQTTSAIAQNSEKNAADFLGLFWFFKNKLDACAEVKEAVYEIRAPQTMSTPAPIAGDLLPNHSLGHEPPPKLLLEQWQAMDEGDDYMPYPEGNGRKRWLPIGGGPPISTSNERIRNANFLLEVLTEHALYAPEELISPRSNDEEKSQKTKIRFIAQLIEQRRLHKKKVDKFFTTDDGVSKIENRLAADIAVTVLNKYSIDKNSKKNISTFDTISLFAKVRELDNIFKDTSEDVLDHLQAIYEKICGTTNAAHGVNQDDELRRLFYLKEIKCNIYMNLFRDGSSLHSRITAIIQSESDPAKKLFLQMFLNAMANPTPIENEEDLEAMGDALADIFNLIARTSPEVDQHHECILDENDKKLWEQSLSELYNIYKVPLQNENEDNQKIKRALQQILPVHNANEAETLAETTPEGGPAKKPSVLVRLMNWLSGIISAISNSFSTASKAHPNETGRSIGNQGQDRDDQLSVIEGPASPEEVVESPSNSSSPLSGTESEVSNLVSQVSVPTARQQSPQQASGRHPTIIGAAGAAGSRGIFQQEAASPRQQAGDQLSKHNGNVVDVVDGVRVTANPMLSN